MINFVSPIGQRYGKDRRSSRRRQDDRWRTSSASDNSWAAWRKPASWLRIKDGKNDPTKAIVFQELHEPLALEMVPDPTPREGELVIKVGRCGICGSVICT